MVQDFVYLNNNSANTATFPYNVHYIRNFSFLHLLVTLWIIPTGILLFVCLDVVVVAWLTAREWPTSSSSSRFKESPANLMYWVIKVTKAVYRVRRSMNCRETKGGVGVRGKNTPIKLERSDRHCSRTYPDFDFKITILESKVLILIPFNAVNRCTWTNISKGSMSSSIRRRNTRQCFDFTVTWFFTL